MAAILAILIPFGPLPALALLASMAPALYVVVKLAQRRHDWHQRTTIDFRRAWYYDTLLTDGEKAAEIRLFDVGGHASRNRIQDECEHLGFSAALR